MLKKLGIITLSGAILAGGILPSISHASNLEVEQTITIEEINDIISSELINVDSVQDISVGDTIEISDAEVIEMLEAQGYDVEQILEDNGINPYARANGSTKIKMLANDYMDIYVSGTVLTLAKVVGATAITAIISALAPWGVGVVAQMANTIIATLSTTKNGRIYKFKLYKRNGMIGSYLYVGSRSQ